MGELIRLAERRQARRDRPRTRPASLRAEFLFDLACPFTYLAAERVERAFDDVTWTAASTTALRRGSLASDEPGPARRARRRGRARGRAAAAAGVARQLAGRRPRAMRVAVYAAEAGRAAAFALAAGRLAFCGGFDLDDPEIIAEAAAAAGLGLDASLRAAGDRRRDGAIEAAGRRLLAAGADRLPALRIGRALYWGEPQVADAAVSARMHAAAALPR